MEKNSSRWLSFLQAHPDPIIIMDHKRRVLFRNNDCIRILTPEFCETNMEEQEALACTEERLSELHVISYPKSIVIDGSEELYQSQSMPINELLQQSIE